MHSQKRHFLFLLIISIVFNASSQEIKAEINLRSSKGKLYKKSLEVPKILENDEFKVVLNTSENALTQSDLDNNELKLRANTIFYHMNLAKKYFDNNYNFLEKPSKVTLRVNQKKLYDPNLHFDESEESRFPLLGATSIKENSFPADSIAPWGKETFFFLPRTIKVKSGIQVTGEVLDQKTIKNSIRKSLLTQNGIDLAADYILKGTLDQFDQQIHYQAILGSFLIPEIAPKLIKGFGKLFKRNIKIDVAMIPEIIYHEYTHHRLHQIFDTSGSALEEGYANYFAYKISGLSRLGDKAKGYIKGSRAKRPQKKVKYNFKRDLRKQKNLSGEFVYSVLIELEEKLNEIISASGDKVIANSLKKDAAGFYFLDKNSKIKGDFTGAVYQGIKMYTQDFEEEFLLKKTAENVFTSFGI